MKQRELINLPFGKYNLTDGIWDYVLSKQLKERDNLPIYSIKELLSGNTLTLFEYVEKEDSIMYKRLSACVNIGGIYIHSKDLSFTFNRLKLKPRSSYRQTFCVSTEDSALINSLS